MKYWRTFLLALQTELQYRANLVGWFVVGAIEPITMVLVWFAILGERQEVAGYGRGDFILYYIFVTLAWYIVGGNFCHQIGNAIHNGDINKTLLKPYSIVWGAAMAEQAWKVTSLLLTIPIFTLILYLTRDYISWQVAPAQLLYLPITLILAAIIFALTQACTGILAFWVTEIWPFADMVEVVLLLFGGIMAPIVLLPPVIQTISLFLPFRYIFYEPLTILLGHQSDPLLIVWKQLAFVAILYLLYKVMWRAGIRRYEGIGG